MKKLLLLLFLIPVFAAAQKTTGGNYTYIAQRYEWLTGLFQALNIPAGDSAQHKSGQDMRAGALYYDTLGIDAGLKIWNGLAWVDIGAGGFFSPDQTSTGNTSHNAAGFNFSINNINDLTLNTDNTIINSANDILIDALGRAYIEADDSIRFLSATGTYNFQNTIASSDTTEMKPAALSSTGQLRRMSYWPGGGGSLDTASLSNRIDANFYQTETIDDTSFVIKRPNGTQDTIVISSNGETVDPGADSTVVSYVIAASDETTDLTTGAAKVTFRMPHAMLVTEVRASINTTSSSGTPTIDINESGVSILSTLITIDVGEKTSFTAATPPVISDATLADDAEITIGIGVAGTGAKGLKVIISGKRP